MIFSDGIKRAAVTGSGQGANLLREVAVRSLQRTAGYMPRTLPDSAYLRQVHDARPVTPSRTTSQLYRMMLGDFQFAHCFPEWCLLVAQHDMRIPSEFIPALLQSDLIYTDWRQVALLAMGSYARWIVAHERNRDHWNWVIKMPTPHLAEIDKDIIAQSDEWVQRYERGRSRTTFHRSLATFQYFWSDALAEVVLRHVDYLLNHLPSDQWRIDLHRIHLCFAYYAPLSYHDRYDTYLQRMREMQITTYDMTDVTAYRHKLRHIITADAVTLSTTKGTG